MSRIKIAIVDDHALVRAGLSRLLERSGKFTVVGTAADAAAAVTLVREKAPALVLLDLSLPDKDGLTLIPELRAASPTTRILIISMYDEPEYVQAALDRGACGLVSKAAAPDALYAAITRAVAGHFDDRPAARLTPREREILTLVEQGKTDAQIAQTLSISEKTVTNYCEHLMSKLGVHTRAGLIAHAKRIELAPRD